MPFDSLHEPWMSFLRELDGRTIGESDGLSRRVRCRAVLRPSGNSARLAMVKAEYYPDNFSSVNQNIAPATCTGYSIRRRASL